LVESTIHQVVSRRFRNRGLRVEHSVAIPPVYKADAGSPASATEPFFLASGVVRGYCVNMYTGEHKR